MIETDFHSSRIMRVNPVIRRVQYIDESGAHATAYPEKFRLGAGGHIFLSWGYE